MSLALNDVDEEPALIVMGDSHNKAECPNPEKPRACFNCGEEGSVLKDKDRPPRILYSDCLHVLSDTTKPIALSLVSSREHAVSARRKAIQPLLAPRSQPISARTAAEKVSHLETGLNEHNQTDSFY